MTTREQHETKQEIERKFLLRGQPAIPAGAEVWRIEQGYFSDSARDPALLKSEIPFGRLRKTVKPDGAAVFTHTVKQGLGMVRAETEREIPRNMFERHWPRTEGCRLRKVRHRVREGDAVWEIDVFDDLDLVLAEIELPRADAAVVVPAWLKPLMVREVTGEASYANSSIAARISTGPRPSTPSQ